MKRICFLAIACLAIGAPAHAASRCVQPYAPVIKAASVTKQDLVTLHDDLASFLTASEVYQKCLAEKGGGTDKIQANQALKEKLGHDFNLLVRASKSARS